jgi:hypothetical protein
MHASRFAALVGALLLVSGGSPSHPCCPRLAGADDKGAVVKVNKMTSTAPADWKSEKPKYTLRSYQFRLAGANDRGDAELSVRPNSSPNVEKEFPRWKAQFVVPEGKTADDLGKTAKWDVPGATVNVLDVSGTWKYKERPFDPKSKEELKDDYRVIWVVISDKDESTHVQLSGPRETVDKHYAAFEKWVKALK